MVPLKELARHSNHPDAPYVCLFLCHSGVAGPVSLERRNKDAVCFISSEVIA